MRYPEEPHTLVRGVAVHIGAISLLKDLLASGYRVRLDPGDGVVIEPLDDLDAFAWALDAFGEDLEILLGVGDLSIH